jgi:hypothetical protein
MALRIGSSQFGNRKTISSTGHRRHPPAFERLDDRMLPSLALPQGLDRGLAGHASPAFVRFSPAVGTTTPTGFTPYQIRHTYGIDQLGLDGAGQTIAIIDAYDDPNIAYDLHQFDVRFGMPDPPSFMKIGQSGGAPPTARDRTGQWEMEEAADVEWAHAIAPGANILLVEANDNSSANLFAAVDFARYQPGVSMVSMSYFDNEQYFSDPSNNYHYLTPPGHAGVTFVACSGDTGVQSYPAASPNVVAVGGTYLATDASGQYLGETGWGGSGGGISIVEVQPAYQKGVVTQSVSRRTNPDVAYNAGYGVAVYDTYNNSFLAPWSSFRGTSAGAPQWSALIALADQGRALRGLGTLDGPSQTLPLLYHLPALAFHDITSGSNQRGSAGLGYDLVTGRGSPIADQVVTRLIQPFAVADGGTTLYQLDESGYLWRYNATGWSRMASNTLSYAVQPNGRLWTLGADGVLRMWTGSSFEYRRSDVRTMVVDGTGRVDVLTTDFPTTANTIWRYIDGTGWQEIDAVANVRTMVVDGTGRLDVLTVADTIWRYIEGAGWQEIDAVGDVRTMAVDGTGRLDVLTAASTVWRYVEGAGWQEIRAAGDARAMAVDILGWVNVLTTANTIWRYRGAGWQEIDAVGNVRAMAVDGLGRVNVLTTANTIWRYLGAGWQQIDAAGNVRSMVVDGLGRVNVLTTANTIWRYVDSTGWREIDPAGNVRTMAVDGTGRLDILTTGGTIWRFVDGAGWQAIYAGNAQTMVVDGTGSLYILDTGRNLSRYIERIGWTMIDGNHDVRSIAGAGDGAIYVVKTNDTVWLYTVSGWTFLGWLVTFV